MSQKPVILVVDDLPASLGDLASLLARAGYEVLAAESGASALHQVGFVTPDLILLDIVMPGIDGYATCQRLRTLPALAGVPILLLTSQDELADKLRGFAAGAVDYITKPFLAEEVLARVATHLRLRALQVEVESRNARLAQEINLRQEAEAQLQQSLDQPVIIATPDGRMLLCTLAARRVLARWFPAVPADTLPAPLTEWASARRGAAGEHAEKFSLAREADTLGARLFADPLSGDCFMLLLEERNATAPAELERLGLSPREAEVLYWLAEGKSYKEIGVILACESRTAQKHAEHIFAKLGVENRHAAALLAREALAGRRTV